MSYKDKKIILLYMLVVVFIFGCGNTVSKEERLIKQGLRYIEQEKYSLALETYQEILTINPSSSRAMFMLGEVYFHDSNLTEFRVQVINFIIKYRRRKSWPKQSQVKDSVVDETLLNKGISYFKRVLEIDFDFKDGDFSNARGRLYIYHQLGRAYLAKKDYNKAKEYFDRSIADDKDKWGSKQAIEFIEYMQKKLSRVYWWGDKRKKEVALTFDDGPTAVYTPKILQILEQYDVKATFFMIGRQVEQFPEITLKVVEQGHCIGNHSYSHSNLYKVEDIRDKKQLIISDIDKAQKAIEKITHVQTSFYRSPYNYLKGDLLEILNDMQYSTISWSYAPGDWKSLSSEIITKNVLDNTRNGYILLLHDGGGDRRQTIQALPSIIKGLRDKGFQLVTVEELLKQ